jgi:hypothetical protein
MMTCYILNHEADLLNDLCASTEVYGNTGVRLNSVTVLHTVTQHVNREQGRTTAIVIQINLILENLN